MIEEKIGVLVKEKFQEEDWQDCFLVEVKQHGNHKLEIFIDSDTGITFDKCRKVSRHLEAVLDEKLWLGEKYTLDVSSPGITRPLKLKRQYQKNIERKMEVKLVEKGKEEGILKRVSDTGIVLEKKQRVKVGKKKKTEVVETEIPFDQIKEAKVKISFN